MVQSGLVVVHGHGAAGTSVSAFTAATGLSVDSLSFSCGAQLPGQGQFDAALVLAGSQQLDHDSYARVIKVLAPGGKLYVFEQDAGKQQQLQGTLVLAGYMDCSVSGSSMVTASKPAWEVGAKSLLKKRPAAAAAAPQPAAVSAAQAWKIGAGDDDDELVDEDELLTEEDKRAAATAPAAGDCSTSRKACKNCSCGRAEAEAAGQKVELTQDMLDNPKTNCGSCALGDAFRCAGCPYRGLPAFEAGKKITLSANFLTADA